jgi:hypothetical protein
VAALTRVVEEQQQRIAALEAQLVVRSGACLAWLTFTTAAASV